MDHRFVRKKRFYKIEKNYFRLVKQRRNQHRRDYSDANADNKVNTTNLHKKDD